MDKKSVDDLLPNSKYIWCLHCEQVDMKTGWVNNYGYCTYDGCNGSVVDAWAWTEIKRIHPEYPETPEYDVVYSLYD